MPGYPVLDRDKQHLEDEFLCEYCRSVLRDATRASCGHFFCSSCMKQLFQNNPGGVLPCSRTGTPLFHYQFSSDDSHCNKVLNLEVHCLFLDAGCLWMGKLHEFEDHVGNCAVGSCQGQKLGLSEADEKRNMEVKSKLNNNEHPQMHMACVATNGDEDSTVPCFYTECDVVMKIVDIADHLEKKCLYRLEKCGYCKAQVNANVMKLHQIQQCPASPVVLDKCGKDEIPQAKKEKVPLPLQRQVNTFLTNKNSPENSMKLKEEIAPSLKEVAAGNCDTRNTSSRHDSDVTEQHEQRLNDLENRVAQHDLLLRENSFLREDIFHLTDAVRDVSNKVDHNQRILECQKRDYDTLLENLNALQIEQINLQTRFNRLLESPLPHGQLARLNRSMETIQVKIVRLERHSRSHGGMLANVADSVTALADTLRHVRVLPVDIQGV